MCDVFLVLAQAPGGLSCFFLPRILPDGTRNRMFLQRLKDKLGNHANASSEVEYDGATAWLVGEEGRGVPTIIEMVNLTRLDCTLGSATSMRNGLTRAIHHAQHRKAFGAYLIDQPLMRNVLADLAVEAEAATIVAMRMAGATDNAVARRRDRSAPAPHRPGRQQVLGLQARHRARGRGDGMPGRQRLRRGVGHATAVPRGAADGHLGRLGQRQRTGHVARHGNSARVRRRDVRRTRQDHRPGPAARRACRRAQARSSDDYETIQYRARKVAEDICLALQGSLLVRHGHPAVAEAFLATRLGGQWGGAFGTMPAGLDVAPILERALVKG